MRQILESDWKTLRKLTPALLERLCGQILAGIAKEANAPGTNHDRYRAVYAFIADADERIAKAFNDHRRSNAAEKLAWMHHFGLLKDEEWMLFSEETRASVRCLSGER